MKTSREILYENGIDPDQHEDDLDSSLLRAIERNTNQFKQEWISVNERTPELIDKKDYSENVWATDGKEVFIMCYCWVKNEGFFWGDCNMKVDGDGEFGDYNVTHWQPLIIPELPKQ